jgi:hypothetical protein
MAEAGMLTVTNTFDNKTSQALERISTNLIAAPPSIEGVASALGAAAGGVDDVERRRRGAVVNWSRDWDQSFDAGLLDQITAYLFSG